MTTLATKTGDVISTALVDFGKLARPTQVVGLAEVPGLAGPVLQGHVRGRTVVDANA